MRAAGDGVFQIDPDSLDEFGALIQFNAASSTRGVVTAGPSVFSLTLPMGTPDAPFDFELDLERVILSGGWTATSTGIASVDETFVIDGSPVEYGGWKLGGVMPLDRLGALLDARMGACICAGFDRTFPVVTYGDNGREYVLAYAQTPAGECTAVHGAICENLALICSFLPSLPSLGLNDIDTNDNGVGDALSVGLRLSAVGATFADPPVVLVGSGE